MTNEDDIDQDSGAPRPLGSESQERASTPLDLDALVTTLETILADPERLLEEDPEMHRRLMAAVGRLAHPDRLARRRFAKTRRRDEINAAKRKDDAALEATSNRSRKRALAFGVPPADAPIDEEARRLLAHQARERERDPNAERLESPRNCYVCKEDYFDLHHHYDSMCPACATLNWLKRSQTADLSGRVAIVTGSRVKIGFEISLMLLRAGARVLATTRFAVDAAERFEAEPDFADWRDRLSLHSLDLRNTPSIESFCAERLVNETRLDFLIHNACQTVRRPPAYYREMVEREDPARLSGETQQLLGSGPAASALAKTSAGKGGDVAALSVIDLLGEAHLEPLFPGGIVDGEGQPLDLRDKNSWRLDLHEVSTVELLEVQLVNAIAPFVLNARLKPLMVAVPTADKHIVNVSAMEGQFYRTFKTTRHPHTNMAKAALNMMTRTSAADYAKDGIFMNSVDTGWVTDEDPFAKSIEKEDSHRFSPPLDSVDGAARVMDPIFTGYQTGEHCWGQFLKDYRPTRW